MNTNSTRSITELQAKTLYRSNRLWSFGSHTQVMPEKEEREEDDIGRVKWGCIYVRFSIICLLKNNKQIINGPSYFIWSYIYANLVFSNIKLYGPLLTTFVIIDRFQRIS